MSAACLVGQIGCGEPPRDAVGHIASPIVGGTETGGDPAVVSVNIGPASVCSGSLIAKNAVLTAGHCVVDPALLIAPGVSVVFGKDGEDFGARWVDAKSWTVHPKYTGTAAYDVSVIVLADDVNDVTPLTLVHDPEALAAGVGVRHVGYGQNDEQKQAGQGVKRTAVYPLTKVEPMIVWSGATGTQTCLGDSGGPALLRVGGVEQILATVSGGDHCYGDSPDARVDVAEVRDWIVKAAGLPPSPPSPPPPSPPLGTDGGPPAAPSPDAGSATTGGDAGAPPGDAPAASDTDTPANGGCAISRRPDRTSFGALGGLLALVVRRLRARLRTSRPSSR